MGCNGIANRRGTFKLKPLHSTSITAGSLPICEEQRQKDEHDPRTARLSGQMLEIV
jgi:hypothetical protein